MNFMRPILIGVIVAGMVCVTRAETNPPATTSLVEQTAAAEAGNAQSQYDLGLRYATGNGCHSNIALASDWYRQAAEQGLSAAQCELGWCYEKGLGVTQDLKMAVEWYRQAAEQGYPKAQERLASCYCHGKGVFENCTNGVAWHRKAAEQGYAGAQMSLGRHYEIGMGVATNYVEAADWYRKGAEQGDADAQYWLGGLYAKGRGVQKDEAEAITWYNKAASQTNIDAMCELGWCYANGLGVTQNLEMEVNWYCKAAEQGDADAQYLLGLLYEKGRGVQKNEAEAIGWLNKAASQTNTRAMAAMADRYFHGRGVARDANKALALMTQAEKNETDQTWKKHFHKKLQLIELYVSLTSSPQISLQNFQQDFPRLALFGPIVLGLLYFILGIPLIIRSYRYRGYPFNLWITLAWLVLFMEGQAFAFGLLIWLPGQITPGLFLAATLLVSALPIIAAALGTLRGPLWGCAVSHATWKVLLCYALWGFGLVLLGDWGYEQFWTLLAQAPLPEQPTAPFILQGFRTAPILTFLTVAILVPVAEEIVFRGFIQDTLQKYLSPAVTILVAAFLFSVIHMQVEFIVPLGIMGLILGWTRFQSKSLLVPVVIHVLNNAYFVWLMWLGF